jgi:hypothetical protein
MHFGSAAFRTPVLGLICLCCLPFAAGAQVWSTGYYPGYRQGAMPASEVDFMALTHVIHFSVAPYSDGTLNTDLNGITPEGSDDLVTQAHAAGPGVDLRGRQRLRRVYGRHQRRLSGHLHRQPARFHDQLQLRRH